LWAQQDPAGDVAEDQRLAEDPGHVRREGGEHDAERDVPKKGYVGNGAREGPGARMTIVRLAAYTGA